jgi:hypothetical protein
MFRRAWTPFLVFIFVYNLPILYSNQLFRFIGVKIDKLSLFWMFWLSVKSVVEMIRRVLIQAAVSFNCVILLTLVESLILKLSKTINTHSVFMIYVNRFLSTLSRLFERQVIHHLIRRYISWRGNWILRQWRIFEHMLSKDVRKVKALKIFLVLVLNFDSLIT